MVLYWLSVISLRGLKPFNVYGLKLLTLGVLALSLMAVTCKVCVVLQNVSCKHTLCFVSVGGVFIISGVVVVLVNEVKEKQATNQACKSL